MKRYILPLFAATTLIASSGFTNDEKPKGSDEHGTQVRIIENPAQHCFQETRKKLSELAHDDVTVMKHFDEFAETLNNAYLKEKSITLQEIQEICAGVDFAAEKHRFQTRKDKTKTPYISHPIGVAYHLISIGEVRVTSLIIGALLHDTVEDTQTTFEEIEEKFGKHVASLVREVTDDKSLAREVRKRLQVIHAGQKSKGAAQIKLADKLFNLNDLYNNPPADWTQTRIDRYYEWAQSVIDRLPKANDKLQEAAETIINKYWDKQVHSK